METGYDSYGPHSKAIDEESDLAIYMLQTIRSEGKKLNLFFDSGCSDMVCKKEAVDWLEKKGKAKNILNGPSYTWGR